MPTIKPPEGGRVHIIEVGVEQYLGWENAVHTGCPNTPNPSDIYLVGDQYPPGQGKANVRLVLLNFSPGDGNWDKALAWAETQGLKRSSPREILADFSLQCPNLCREFGQNQLTLVATNECTFEGDRWTCSADCSDAGCVAFLRTTSNCGHTHDWFAFSQ